MSPTVRARARAQVGRCVLALLTCLIGLAACTRTPETAVTPLRASSIAQLRIDLLNREADSERFKARGPFGVDVHENSDLWLSDTERIEADVYLVQLAESAPLVILVHGHDNSKADHAYQAMHLASWGMHAISVQLPNNGPWIRNGQTLARIVAMLRNAPDAIDRRIDATRIVLAGHSFGGTAAAVALGAGAPAVAAILLDPAGIGNELRGYLRKVRAPIMVLGADGSIVQTRRRAEFYAYVQGPVAEVSIKGAHHEDAQFPLEPELQKLRVDTSASEEMQIAFVSALTSSAFSLAFTGRLDYAWSSFDRPIRAGKMFDPLRR